MFRVKALVAMACVATAGVAWPVAASAAASSVSLGTNMIPARLLAMHNLERSRVNSPPLHGTGNWPPQPRPMARRWHGSAICSIRRAKSRPGQRENLWMGTRGAFSPEQMVGSWIEERNEFRPGVFPAVSRTGDWSDVAHYTQLIWKETTRVGCAIQPAGQWDYLICRYSPPGNIDGRRLP